MNENPTHLVSVFINTDVLTMMLTAGSSFRVVNGLPAGKFSVKESGDMVYHPDRTEIELVLEMDTIGFDSPIDITFERIIGGEM
jgi:hypothetical protein